MYMFISNSLNMPSPILPLKVAHDLLIQEKILGKTSKKKKKTKGEKEAALFLLKSLRKPELPFKLHPHGLQGGGLALHRLESPLPWPWLPGWPRPQRPWTSATARESGRL